MYYRNNRNIIIGNTRLCISIILVALRWKPCDKFLSAWATEHRGEIFINGGFYMKKDLAKAISLGVFAMNVCVLSSPNYVNAEEVLSLVIL